jgi:hypothetical protein
MSTRDDAQSGRVARARETLAPLTPWLGYVAGATQDRLPALLLGDTRVDVNAPLALVEVEVQAQLRLLLRLHQAGLLRDPGGRAAPRARWTP